VRLGVAVLAGDEDDARAGPGAAHGGDPVKTFEVRFVAPLHLAVSVEAEDEDQAGDVAHDAASAYLETVMGNHRDVAANASLDGVGHDEIEEVQP
jgi:hypothetical protein